MSEQYEGLTPGQYEDFEEEYDDSDWEFEEPAVFVVDENDYSPVSDEDGGYGTYSYFARAMIRE